MRRNSPRVVLAGTNSGCGKTTIACAILQAFMERGLRVGSFKCGPDYIDPMFHSKIIGAKSGNIDLFFFSANTARQLLAEGSADCDVSIVEGVMGFYDGLGLTSTRGSTYDVSESTRSPVILIVDAKGAALSVLATIHGFMTLIPENRICGVILNRCSASTYGVLAEEIRKRFAGRIEPLGFMPVMKDCVLESRHLGLVMADEIGDLREKLRLLAAQAERTIELDKLLEIARQSEELEYEPFRVRKHDKPVRIAVARDRAFCFYYEDSLNVLRDMGAELVSFSPLEDEALPPDVQGLYLGGGYPELHAQQLSTNRKMSDSIRNALQNGLPCIAECGGFMYLTERIGEYPMVGYLKGTCADRGKLTRFGYVTLHLKRDCMLGRAGEQIAAHEFHHWDCEYNGDAFAAVKSSGKSWDCAYATDTLYAGFPHFHFCANPAFAENFYQTCLKEKHSHD